MWLATQVPVGLDLRTKQSVEINSRVFTASSLLSNNMMALSQMQSLQTIGQNAIGPPYSINMIVQRDLLIPVDGVTLAAEFCMPPNPIATIIFAVGGANCRGESNQAIAEAFNVSGFATLIIEFLTPEEEALDKYERNLRVDVDLLQRRLRGATEWLCLSGLLRNRIISPYGEEPSFIPVKIGYFAASTGASAAILCASVTNHFARIYSVNAVVMKAGRPDLAGDAVGRYDAPTLLLVGELDDVTLAVNRLAMTRMRCKKELVLLRGVDHVLDVPAAQAQVQSLACAWFSAHLTA